MMLQTRAVPQGFVFVRLIGRRDQRCVAIRRRRQQIIACGQGRAAILVLFGRCRAQPVNNRRARRFLSRDDGQGDRCCNETSGEDPGNLAQSGCSRAARNSTAATTDAKATALRPLQQHHSNQAKGQNQVNDQNDIFHGRDCFRFWLAGIYSSLPMGARVDCRAAAIGLDRGQRGRRQTKTAAWGRRSFEAVLNHNM